MQMSSSMSILVPAYRPYDVIIRAMRWLPFLTPLVLGACSPGSGEPPDAEVRECAAQNGGAQTNVKVGVNGHNSNVELLSLLHRLQSDSFVS